jgi:hypothetical protein
MSGLEAQARTIWRGWAEYRGYTRCDECGQPRYCGRARRRGRRLCLACFEFTPEGRRQAKRRARQA